MYMPGMGTSGDNVLVRGPETRAIEKRNACVVKGLDSSLGEKGRSVLHGQDGMLEERISSYTLGIFFPQDQRSDVVQVWR